MSENRNIFGVREERIKLETLGAMLDLKDYSWEKNDILVIKGKGSQFGMVEMVLLMMPEIHGSEQNNMFKRSPEVKYALLPFKVVDSQRAELFYRKIEADNSTSDLYDEKSNSFKFYEATKREVQGAPVQNHFHLDVLSGFIEGSPATIFRLDNNEIFVVKEIEEGRVMVYSYDFNTFKLRKSFSEVGFRVGQIADQ